MDPFTSPEPVASSRRDHRGPVLVAVLILVLLAVTIGGSALWRPEPVSRVTLQLGGSTPVGLETDAPDETIARVMDAVGPTVAFLLVPGTGPGPGRSGSGVVVHEAGFVVTNAHVVEGADTLTVAFDDGSQYEATVFGVDASTDLAVVKLRTSEPVRPAALGDSDALQVGEFVLALGAPFGLAASVTSGIVSGLHRDGLGIAQYEDFIVTDAPINRGNSGGPLVNLRGEVIGINTAIIAGEDDTRRGPGGFSGVGFAIPVNVMRVVAQRLIGDGGLESADGPTADAAPLAGSFTVRTVAGPASPMRRVAEDLDGSLAFLQSFDASGYSAGVGTGFVISSDIGNVLLTNQHVVQNETYLSVFFTTGGPGVPGKVLAANDALDLAVVSFPGADQRVPLPVTGSAEVAIGDSIVAWAARLSEDGSPKAVANAGDVTDKGLYIRRIAARATLTETSAAVERGDSGGPVLDANGSVVAVIVGQDIEESPGAGGRRSLAIELYLDKNLAEILDAAANPGFNVGARIGFPDNYYVFVTLVDPDGPLGEAGFQNLDRVVSIGGDPIGDTDADRRAAWRAFTRLPGGTKVEIVIERRPSPGEPHERQTIEFTVPPR